MSFPCPNDVHDGVPIEKGKYKLEVAGIEESNRKGLPGAPCAFMFHSSTKNNINEGLTHSILTLPEYHKTRREVYLRNHPFLNRVPSQQDKNKNEGITIWKVINRNYH